MKDLILDAVGRKKKFGRESKKPDVMERRFSLIYSASFGRSSSSDDWHEYAKFISLALLLPHSKFRRCERLGYSRGRFEMPSAAAKVKLWPTKQRTPTCK